MRIGLNLNAPFSDTVSISLDENSTTVKDLLELTALDNVITCRFLKIPKTSKDKLQTININSSNVGSTLAAVGFQGDANYTIIPL